MAENTTTSNGADDARATAMHAVGEAQERLKAGAGQVADRLPEAMATAQVAARDTQQALNQMPEPTLIAGASFSLGLAVGLFFAGVNRLLVLAALAPAAAMAATLFSRQNETAGTTTRRRNTTTG